MLKPNLTRVALFGLALCLSGCASVMDPTNAQSRADKMEKALQAQRQNPMGARPNSNPQGQH